MPSSRKRGIGDEDPGEIGPRRDGSRLLRAGFLGMDNISGHSPLALRMTSRTPYKPEGWPTSDDLALMSSQDVREHVEEIKAARDEFEYFVRMSWANDAEADSANQRLVIAYRALKAWEAERG
jgi:hypothetical protein